MLNLILGGAKTGKSFYSFEKIEKISEEITQSGETYSNEQIILIVPEQFSYEAERGLFEKVGGKSFLNIKVTSFTRLALEIFQQFGGISGEYADDCAKIILMNKAINSCLPDLDIYKNSAKYANFASKMMTTINEFKLAGIEYDEFNDINITADVSNEYLKLKLKEIAQIYTMYEAELESSNYIDQTDDLSRALKLIQKNLDFIKGKHIFIDEFKGFTKIELDFLALLMIHAQDVYVALCIDNTRKGDLLSPFASILETKNDIMKLATKNSIKVKKPIIMEEIYEDKIDIDPVIKHLEKNIFSDEKEKYSNDVENNIQGIICTNEYEELEFILSTISKMIIEGEYTYNDFAVISRDMASYEDIYENLFEKYDIPVFYDKVESVIDMPLIKFVQAFLNCVIKGMTTENILSMLKCELMPFTLSQISLFENFLFIWDIRNLNSCKEDFIQNPSGFKSEFDENDEYQLSIINEIRAFCYNNIKNFKTKNKEANGYEFCTSIMDTVEIMQVKDKLIKQINYFTLIDDTETVDILNRVWEIFNELLTTIGNAIGNGLVDEKNFNDLFSLVAQTYDMGSVPQSLDSVTLGSADRIRMGNKKVIFILSVNEGIFPLTPVNNSLLTNREREVLSSLSLPIPTLGIEKIKEERFIAYKTLTSTSKKLYLTARMSNIKGDSLIPSIIFDELQEIFGEEVIIQASKLSVDYFCHNNSTILKQYLFNEDDKKIKAHLDEVLKDNKIIQNKLEAIKDIKSNKGFKISNEKIAIELFKENMILSPSKIEKYFDCPFNYFCQYGIVAKPLTRAKINPLQSGNLIHQLLDKVVQEVDFNQEFNEIEIKSTIQNELSNYIETQMGGKSTKDERFLYICNRMQTPLFEIVKRIYNEFLTSEFKPVAYEAIIGGNNYNNGKYITPLMLKSKKGRISVIGKIDRVDQWLNQEKNEKYIRIIDYKSGTKKFDLNDVYNGISLQMLVYLQTIIESGSKIDTASPTIYDKNKPAGILYMPSTELSPVNVEKVEDNTQKFLDGYQMNGLIVETPENPEILIAMENVQPENGAVDNRYIPKVKLPKPPKILKNGEPSKAKSENKEYIIDKSLVTPAQLEIINNYIKSKIVNMVDSLHQGEISATPLNKETLACEYCDYISVCGNTDITEDKVKEYIKIDNEQELRNSFDPNYEREDNDNKKEEK